jgi:hypothetical protein
MGLRPTKGDEDALWRTHECVMSLSFQDASANI